MIVYQCKTKSELLRPDSQIMGFYLLLKKQTIMNFYLPYNNSAIHGVLYVILFIGLTILIEGLVLLLFKIENAEKSFLYSLIVNLASLGAVYVLSSLVNQLINSMTQPGMTLRWALLFTIVVLIEGFLLLVLTKKKPKERVWLATLVMNLLSYVVLYSFFW